jgi:uncharacterized protein YukE
MTDQLRVDPGALRQAHPELIAVGDSVAATLARLTAALAIEGPCWGSDDTGRTFAAAYLPAGDAIRALLHGTAQRAQEIGAGVQAAADAFDRANGAAAQQWRD